MLASETKAKAGSGSARDVMCSASLSLFSFVWFSWAEALAWGQCVWCSVYVLQAYASFSGHMMGAVAWGLGNEEGDEGAWRQWGRDHIFRLSAVRIKF